MDPDTFARLSARLQRGTDYGERGQLLPLTEAALGLPPAERLPALVAALSTERLIVPVPVEARPGGDGAHLPVDLGGDSSVPLATGESPAGPAIVAFTQAERLVAWDGGARPAPMAARRVALTAIATGTERIWVDPGSGESSVLIPRPAVVALAHGDVWMPASRDPELAAQLRQIAARPHWVAAADIRIDPEDPRGLVRIHVTLAAAEPGRLDRAMVAGLLAELAASPRLGVAADTVEFVPQLAPLV